jgi:hypothetical protein
MIGKASLAAALAAASLVIGGCGGSTRTATGSAGTSNWVTHADPVNLLPPPGEVSTILKHASATNRYDQALDETTVDASFGTASPAVMKLASGTAELSLMGSGGSQLYAQVFVFKTLDAARSLTAAFLTRTRLSHPDQPSSGIPGEQGEASRQLYGHGDVSYRYAFRDQNVLCLVELDGLQGRYTLADAITVARMADRQIGSALS